jgi:alginate O-acetyltransferase complex protein AlgI
LRDYLYIPLGGSRYGLRRQMLALFITMFLAGLWHGAGWVYAVFGILH